MLQLLWKTSRYIFFVMLLGATSSHLKAQTQKQCPAWVPTRDQSAGKGAALKNTGLAPMHRAALALHEVVKKNAAFNSIPDARFRTSYFVYTGDLNGAQVNVKAYSKDGWDNKCGIIPQADRISADDAGISFKINNPGHIIVNQFDNMFKYLEKINAFAEPTFLGTLAEGVPYYKSGVTGQEFAMLTYDGRVPWVPLTQEEYLDAYEEHLSKKIADFEAEKKRKERDDDYNKSASEKSVKEYYESLKKTDPKKAEEYLVMMKKIKDDMVVMKKKEAKQLAANDSALQKEMNDFRKYRTSLSPDELKRQAVAGNNQYNLWEEGSKSPKRPLVKMAPGFLAGQANKNVIRLITIWQGGNVQWQAYARKAWESLDFDVLKKLLR